MWLWPDLCSGGERILEVFDIKLKDAIYKLPFDKILTLKARPEGQAVGADCV